MNVNFIFQVINFNTLSIHTIGNFCFQKTKVVDEAIPSSSKSQRQDNLEVSPESGGSLPTPSPAKDETPTHTASKPPKKNNKGAKNSCGAEQEFLSSMKNTMNTMVEAIGTRQQAAKNQKSPSPDKSADEHDIWAKLLATKVRRMDHQVADDFKLEVDTLAVSYLKK